MLDPNIINEAYDELNETGLIKEDVIPEGGVVKETKADPKLERVKKLVSDIQSILYKLQDDEYNKEYGKEDDDIRDEMKKAMSKAMYKMVDRLKNALDGKDEDKEEKKEEDKEEKKEEDKEEKKEEEKEEDKEEKKEEDKEEKKEEEKEDDDDDKEEEKDEEKSKDSSSNFMKLFPTTEAVTSPQGKKYIILESNQQTSFIKDIASGDKFKIDTNILLKWKNN